MSTIILLVIVIISLFPCFIGFWEYFGNYPKLVACSKKMYWPAVIVLPFVLGVVFWDDEIDLTKDWDDILLGILIIDGIFAMLIYSQYFLGRHRAKKYEQKEKEKVLKKELQTDPEPKSKYFSWENIDMPVQEYTLDMAFERIIRDILQSTSILENNEDIARHKKQADLVDKIFLSAQKSLVDGEPRLLGGMGDDTVKVLAQMEGTPFFFSLLPERKGPDGTVHRRGQIQVGDSKSYSITVIYELGLKMDDPTQWWKCREPKQTFSLTTRRKQES